MRLSLRAGERVYINGAVLRADRKVSIELLNDASFLLETHVLQAEDATTPLRQFYFAAQTILIDPASAPRARDLCRSLQAGILAAVTDPGIRASVVHAGALIEADRLIEALKLIRGLYKAEAALLAEASAPIATPADAASPRRPQPESPTHPA